MEFNISGRLNWFVGKTKYSTDIRRSRQIILTKLPPVIGVARRATTSFEAWYCFIAGEFLDNIIRHTEQHIFFNQHYVSLASDDQLTDEIDIKFFIGLLCLVGAFQNNKQSLLELWVTNGYDIEKFRLGINLKPFKFLIMYILE